MLPYALEIGVEGWLVVVFDDAAQGGEFFLYLRYLRPGVRIEENLAQEPVVLTQYAAGYLHVPLERSARRVLVFHHRRKDKGADEGDAQGVGHGLVMLAESVLAHVKPKAGIEVAEEDAAHIVALGDDDGTLRAQRAEVGERGAEHGMRRDVAPTARLVELAQAGLDGGYVAYDAVRREMGQGFAEDGKRLLERHGIDDQLRAEVVHLVKGGEAERIVHEAETLRRGVEHGCFVLKAKEVGEERTHLPRPEYKYSHFPMG